MALIKCSECGHMISDKAQRCPKCGAPIYKDNHSPIANETSSIQNKNKTVLWVFIALLICVLGGGWIYSASNSKSNNESKKPQNPTEEHLSANPIEEHTNQKTFVYSIAKDGFLNIRQSPSADSKIIGRIITGVDSAELIDNSEQWFKVKKDNIVGYVNSIFVSYNSPQ